MLEIPLAWVLAYPLGFGPTGVFIAVSVAFSVLAVVSAVPVPARVVEDHEV